MLRPLHKLHWKSTGLKNLKTLVSREVAHLSFVNDAQHISSVGDVNIRRNFTNDPCKLKQKHTDYVIYMEQIQ